MLLHAWEGARHGKNRHPLPVHSRSRGGDSQSRSLPVELAEACFERIRAYDAPLNSFITVTYDFGMAQARQAESELAAGHDRGPLHGIPIALKDLYATKGIKTTAHSEVLVEWMPPDDATTTTLLREAGTSLLGKLAMHEFAAGPLGFDTPFPPARNPWNTQRVPGGSSSGSGSALAAGFCYGSLGSDTGGSIRGHRQPIAASSGSSRHTGRVSTIRRRAP